MNYPKKFIKATEKYNTLEEHVPAPYIRKSFVSNVSTTGKIILATCGFYELYFNGTKLTKGFLAPYISNTDHYIYCDEYELKIEEGENVLGILLGNGFQNNPGGYIWDFDKAAFRSAPMVAINLVYNDKDGNEVLIESDVSFKTHPSPIRSDDYRFGEHYDANYEIKGWDEKNFDDSDWNDVIETNPPRGTLKICPVEPIINETEIKPIKIIKSEDGYIYDFGIVNAGVCRLNVCGEKGQKIELQYGELLKDGNLFIENIWFLRRRYWERDKNIVHKDIYVCSGNGIESYVPTFTYHGFRYVKVTGITENQADSGLLTYLVMHSDIKSIGGFTCSDEIVNKLQEITRRSDLSNFYYFPTDCPQREKNGWTADAALSCEQMLLNFAPEVSYREWMCNIRKAQDENGALPGIIPTAGWGFEWGNGPAWDCVLAYLPYYVYKYRGETEMIVESSHAFMSYLHYLTTRTGEEGLIHIGLGDWCHVGGIEPKAPLALTDSVISMDIAEKMSFMFGVIGYTAEQEYAKTIAMNFRRAIRKNLLNHDNMVAAGECQTSQAMCLFYNVFEPEETDAAFQRLIEMIDKEDDHIDVGVLGGRVIFHVLSKFNRSDLALKMIIRKDYPSYGNWIERGATTLWESFRLDRYESTNHHFWGDISAWFIKTLSGINYNPDGKSIKVVEFKPSFVKELENAEGFYDSPEGRIVSSWKRTDETIMLSLTVPKSMKATAILESGFIFDDGLSKKKVTTGNYKIIQC
jgi:alpha-L-rhamnosidase